MPGVGDGLAAAAVVAAEEAGTDGEAAASHAANPIAMTNQAPSQRFETLIGVARSTEPVPSVTLLGCGALR